MAEESCLGEVVDLAWTGSGFFMKDTEKVGLHVSTLWASRGSGHGHGAQSRVRLTCNGMATAGMGLDG